MKRTLLPGFALLLVTGCFGSSPRSSFTALNPMPSRPAKSAALVHITPVGEKPPCETVIVGRAVGRGGGYEWNSGDNVATEQLRKEVAAHGLDGVMDFQCAPPGTMDASYGTCTGTAYYCKQ